MKYPKRYLLSFALLVTVIGYAVSLHANAMSETVSRGDFAVKIAEALNVVPITLSTPCYKDLSISSPYSAKVCALKKSKIFMGLNTSSFKPDSPVNFAFVVQSICRAQKWTKTPSFSKCNSILKQNKLLTGTLWKNIRGNTRLNQEQVNNLIDSLLKKPPTEKKRPAAEQSQDAPPRVFPNVSFSPVSDGTIPSNFYSKIILDNPLPKHFYLDEVYVIEGNLNSGVNEKEIFAFLCAKEKGCGNTRNFIANVKDSHFKIPVHFNEPGNFELGIIPGRSGQSLVETISVLAKDPTVKGQKSAPNSLFSQYVKGKTAFKWNTSGEITQLVIFQDKERKDYIFRQPTTFYEPMAKDFQKFKKGNASWLVANDGNFSPPQTISLTVQDLRTIDETGLTVMNLSEVYPGPGRFEFTGKALSTVSKKAAITLPSGKVQEVIFASKDIAPLKEFAVSFDMNSIGTYIFEINNPSGGAVVNIPIYVGSEVPLLPDFFSKNTAKLVPGDIENIEVARKTLLDLINKDRATLSLPSLKISSKLNEIAQAHSSDMVSQNFFGHINHSGLGPDERRKQAGFTSPIKENLGKAAGLNFVQAGLMRSPIHRAVIIDPTMTQVGLGIVKDPSGYYIVTQNFAGESISEMSLETYKNILYTAVNEFRKENDLAEIILDSKLNTAANEWSKRMGLQGFFDIEDSNGATLIQVVRENGVTSAFQMNIVSASEITQIIDALIKQAGLQNSSMNKIGIGITANKSGELLLTTLYAP